MKRDWDLLRWLLNEVESCQGGYPVVLTHGQYGSPHYKLDIEERDFGEVYEHILLLGDNKLAEVRELKRGMSGPSGVVIDRLTMAGHDFLDAARDESRWKKALQVVREKGGGAVTVGILTELLTALMKQGFGLK